MDSPSTLARPHPQASPRWLAVANVIFAGIAAALHVGKATIALPSLQRSFGGDLAALSWIMSAFPFVGVFGGIAAGLLVRRWGDRRLLTGGLAILGGRASSVRRCRTSPGCLPLASSRGSVSSSW